MKRRKRRVKGFKDWSHAAKAKRSDGSVERAHREAQERFRDFWTDSYRSQSAQREASI